jgi:hypothetical protein
MNPCRSLKGFQIDRRLWMRVQPERPVDIVHLEIHLVRGVSSWRSGGNMDQGGKHGRQLGLFVVTRMLPSNLITEAVLMAVFYRYI